MSVAKVEQCANPFRFRPNLTPESVPHQFKINRLTNVLVCLTLILAKIRYTFLAKFHHLVNCFMTKLNFSVKFLEIIVETF